MPIMGVSFTGPNILPILFTIFWIWMMLDCVLNKHLRGGSKVFWLLLIFFTNIVGAAIYFFVECQHRNPIEACRYYYQTFAQASRPAPPTQSTPSRPAPPVYTPPATIYSDYDQGYRAQQPATPVESSTQSEGTPYSKPAQEQPEYEQTIISYPEMPPPQQ